MAERASRVAAGEVVTEEDRNAHIQQIVADRVPDLRCLLDTVLAGSAGEVARQIDGHRIGLLGWSFGGWAVLAALEVDDRFGAVVALAPAGSSKPLPGIIPASLTFKWRRDVPALFLVAERDQYTPLPGMYELFTRSPSSKRVFILRHADHGHFGDHIEDPGLCSPGNAQLFTRSLGLSHLDAVLKESRAARQFLAVNAVAELKERGVDAIAYGERL